MKCDRCGCESKFQGYFKGENLCKRCYDKVMLNMNEEDKRAARAPKEEK